MPFQPFSREHLVTVTIGAMAVAALILAGKRGGNGRLLATALLAFLNLSAYPLNQAAWLSLGKPLALENILPLHLCDIAAMTAGFALITKRPILCALTYFWGLAATFQALLTPAIGIGFPAWPFITFFIQHFAIVAAALYLPLVEGWRPKTPLWKSPLEVYGWSIAYLVFALSINFLLDTNFGFATRPPDNPSLIDHLGPWPWYLLWMQLIAILVFLLLALPLRGSGERKGKSQELEKRG
ncbi:MAG: TIGR02206 family membrane protein [Luteolibacter sp.]|jgi:hypothetical integral membrane protein (TIGR02206 family)|nr:TIGR02206 family membrane protein [Luteolibacter sp.]